MSRESVLKVAVALVLFLNAVKCSQVEENLAEYLFTNYTKHIRPSESVSDSVRVEFSITLLQLIRVDEKAEAMTTSQYITLCWHDARLRWDPADFEGLETLRVPCEFVWKPDLALSNNVEGKYDKTIPVNALLNHTGDIEWLPPAIYTSSCSIKIEYFPFDWQNCSLRFQSFTYNSEEIILHPMYSKAVVDEAAYTENGEWDIVHCPVKVNADSSNFQYQDITLYFIIKRKPLFYITNIIIPCILISSSSFLVFCLPCASCEKTNLSISVLLGLPVYLLVLSKSVPETSLAVPLIGMYLLFTMCTVTSSVICSVAVLSIYHRSPLTHVLSPWLRCVFLDFLAPLLHMSTNVQIMRKCSIQLSGRSSECSSRFQCSTPPMTDRKGNKSDDSAKSKVRVRNCCRSIFGEVGPSQTSKNKLSKCVRRNPMAKCIKSISIDVQESDSSYDSDTIYPGERAIERINRAQQQRLDFRNDTIAREELVTFKGKTSTHIDTCNNTEQNPHQRESMSLENGANSEHFLPVVSPHDCDQQEYFRLTYNNGYLDMDCVVPEDSCDVNDESCSLDHEDVNKSGQVAANRAVTFAPSSHGSSNSMESCAEPLTRDRAIRRRHNVSRVSSQECGSAWDQCFDAIHQISGYIEFEKSYKTKVVEWQMIAMVLDRLMFYVFLLIYSIGTAIFAIKAGTNYPPDHPFLAGEPKYINCWKDHAH